MNTTMQVTHMNNTWTFTLPHDDDMYRGSIGIEQLQGRLKQFVTVCPESIERACHSGTYSATTKLLTITIEYIGETILVDLNKVVDPNPEAIIKSLQSRIETLEARDRWTFYRICITARQMQTFVENFLRVTPADQKYLETNQQYINMCAMWPQVHKNAHLCHMGYGKNVLREYVARVRGLVGNLGNIVQDHTNLYLDYSKNYFTGYKDVNTGGCLQPGCYIQKTVGAHELDPAWQIIGGDGTQITVREPLDRIPAQLCKDLGLD